MALPDPDHLFMMTLLAIYEGDWPVAFGRIGELHALMRDGSPPPSWHGVMKALEPYAQRTYGDELEARGEWDGVSPLEVSPCEGVVLHFTPKEGRVN